MKSRMDFFITGTDTGVGKTFVTAALLAALRARGTDAVAMKPVQTGANRGRSPDLDFCAKASAWKIPADEFDDLCPYRFAMPASPHLAAKKAKRKIKPQKIIAAFRRLQKNHEAVLVEGAGGLLVPLGEDFDQRDLMQAMKLPVIVVARPGLGTLNHTRLTVEALQARRIIIACVVLSHESASADAIRSDNERFLKQKLFPIPVVAMPFVRESNFLNAGKRLLALRPFTSGEGQ